MRTGGFRTMETVTEALFNAFAEGEILTEDSTYRKMMEEFAEGAEQVKTGTMDDESLFCLQYVAMRAGFYAGINAMRSVITG